jgi:hypothetical protein
MVVMDRDETVVRVTLTSRRREARARRKITGDVMDLFGPFLVNGVQHLLLLMSARGAQFASRRSMTASLANLAPILAQ